MFSETSKDDTSLGGITSPELLNAQHDLSQFDCSEFTLNKFLVSDAWGNQCSGASTTYVVCTSGTNRVVGYFSLSSGAVDREYLMGKLKRKMPKSVPVTVLGRLAVDSSLKGQKVGSSLLKAAWQTAADQSQLVGSVALLVNSLEGAVSFYKQFGFKPVPSDELTLVISLR